MVRRLRSDKRSAFRAFYAGTVRQVAAHLRKMGADRGEDLEDVLQETYAEAYKSFDSLLDDQAALAWLLTIARRQWARALERKTRQAAEAQSASVEDCETLARPAHGAATFCDTAMDAQRLCEGVRAMVAQIADPRKRQVIEMFYFEEYTLPEINDATGVGTSTMTTWLARFRKDVRESLGAQRSDQALAPKGAAWGRSP